MEIKRAVLACVLCAAMVASGLFVATPAKALDTSNVLVVDIRGAVNPPAGINFFDVAWTSDGKYALFVGTDGLNGVAWWYNPTKVSDAAWTPAALNAGSPVATQFKSVLWDPVNSMFIVVGDAISGRWYHVAAPGEFLIESAPDADLQAVGPYIEDMVFNGGVIYAAARMAIMGYIFAFDCAGWDWALVSGSTLSNANWYACEFYSNRVYCCGSDGGTSGLYAYYDLPAGPWHTAATIGSLMFTDMALDTFDYDRMLLTTKGRVGFQFGVMEASGADLDMLDGLANLPLAYDLNAITVDSEGFAIAVGQDTGSGNGLVYDIWWTGSTTSYVKRSAAAPPYSGQNFKGVAMRPTGVQMALISGSSFKYSYTSVLAPIQVDTGVPHVDYLDLYPTGTGLGSSVLNSQVDVDIGDSSTIYTLEIRIFDNLGVARMTNLEAWLWYDEGNTATDVGPLFSVPGSENKRMRFNITSGNVVTQEYPAPGPVEETSLISGNWQVMDATSAIVVLNFSSHQQVRWAASAGGFVEGPGTRYGGMVSEGQSTINALNAANTWDIKVNVTDDAPTTNYASAYDEFGFYKYTYLSTSGIPNGGAVYGSGAPGTPNVVMSISGENVTFAANCPYTLNAQLMGNLIGVAFAGTINANQISIQGGAIGARTAFALGGGTQTLIGAAQQPLDSLRTTTTSSWDGNSATWEPVRWWVNIPGVVEDRYVSQVTWSLTN
ncbi:MAG: hypothetical protein V1934_03890 [Methanobacteriota archaeon]